MVNIILANPGLYVICWGLLKLSVCKGADESDRCGQATILEGSDENVKIPWTATIIRHDLGGPPRFIPSIVISPTILVCDAAYLVSKPSDLLAIYPFAQYEGAVGSGRFGDVDSYLEKKNVTYISVHPKYRWKERKEEEYMEVLFHLESPLNISDTVQPICLPSTEEMINELKEQESNETTENSVVVGWEKDDLQLVSLRMQILSGEECGTKWEYIHGKFPYRNRFCATITKGNNHTKCVNRSLGGMKKVNGSYYLSGRLNEYYDLKDTNISVCEPDSVVYFFRWLSLDETYSWIDKNKRCGSHSYTCLDGTCIPLSKLCNKVDDCGDSSDENAEYCRLSYGCTLTEFYCPLEGRCYSTDLMDKIVCYSEDSNDDATNGSGFVIPLVIAICLLVPVFATMSVLFLRRIRNLKKKIRDLTDTEVHEFLYGYNGAEKVADEVEIDNDSERYKDCEAYYCNNDLALQLPWDKTYEIDMDFVEMGDVINCGNFGIVYKANYHKDKNYVKPVAVKTHLSNMGLVEFKTILSELKILVYVGSHPHIVSLYGACTKDIKKRLIYMVMEYCSNGDLHKFLITNKSTFEDTTKTTDDEFTVNNLFNWSYQIALGMEFLSSKNIVHGDLATRNVLLTDSFDAKIADFGLSRQLDLSGVYVKHSQEPLPWKWLAVEALEKLEFSTKSDVWSFGVTLWELFSLGEEPYHGFHFGKSFLEQIMAGLRLDCPVLAPQTLYDLMSACWNHDGHTRPDFGHISSKLKEILNAEPISYQIQCIARRNFESASAESGYGSQNEAEYIWRDEEGGSYNFSPKTALDD